MESRPCCVCPLSSGPGPGCLHFHHPTLLWGSPPASSVGFGEEPEAVASHSSSKGVRSLCVMQMRMTHRQCEQACLTLSHPACPLPSQTGYQVALHKFCFCKMSQHPVVLTSDVVWQLHVAHNIIVFTSNAVCLHSAADLSSV